MHSSSPRAALGRRSIARSIGGLGFGRVAPVVSRTKRRPCELSVQLCAMASTAHMRPPCEPIPQKHVGNSGPSARMCTECVAIYIWAERGRTCSEHRLCTQAPGLVGQRGVRRSHSGWSLGGPSSRAEAHGDPLDGVGGPDDGRATPPAGQGLGRPKFQAEKGITALPDPNLTRWRSP